MDFELFGDNTWKLYTNFPVEGNSKVTKLLAKIGVSEDDPTREELEEVCKLYGVSLEDMTTKRIKLKIEFE